MSFSSNLQAVAIRLLASYGQSATITSYTDAGYDPGIGEVTRNETSWTADIYPDLYTTAEINGVSVLSTDSKVYTHSGNSPQVGNTINFNATEYRIMDVQKISAQGADILYVLQVRV